MAHGAVCLHDRGLYDHKLICTADALRPAQLRRRRLVLAFFRLYGWANRLLNLSRGRPGRTGLHGWVATEDALGRARPVTSDTWSGPSIPF